MLIFNKKNYNKTTIKRNYENFSGLLQLAQTIPNVVIKYHLFNDNVDIYFPIKSYNNNIQTLYENNEIIFK